MLSRPKYGWTTVTVAEKVIGAASYLDDIPMMLLSAMCQYFSKNNYMNFDVQFDAEGYYFGLMEFDDELFFLSTETNDAKPIIELISEYSKNTLKELAKELVNEIREYIEDWVYWDTDYEEMTEEEKYKRKMELLNHANTLEQLINN